MSGDLEINKEIFNKELEIMTKDGLFTIAKFCKKIKINESTLYRIRSKGITSKKTILKLIKGGFTRSIIA